jgi:tetratricopeptide (TPR) repeat protein
VSEALRAYNNLLVTLEGLDRPEEIGPVTEEALALARRRGDRFWETRLAAVLLENHRLAGDWDSAVTLANTLDFGEGTADVGLTVALTSLLKIAIDRGDEAEARSLVARFPTDVESSDQQHRSTALYRRQIEAELDGDHRAALADVQVGIRLAVEIRNAGIVADLLANAALYAVATGDHAAALAAASAADSLHANAHTRAMDSQLHRLRANAASAVGDEDAAAEAYGIALANARNLGYRYWLAPVLFDYGRWLVATGREEEGRPLLDEAREQFEHMGATYWLDRLDALDATRLVTTKA